MLRRTASTAAIAVVRRKADRSQAPSPLAWASEKAGHRQTVKYWIRIGSRRDGRLRGAEAQQHARGHGPEKQQIGAAERFLEQQRTDEQQVQRRGGLQKDGVRRSRQLGGQRERDERGGVGGS